MAPLSSPLEGRQERSPGVRRCNEAGAVRKALGRLAWAWGEPVREVLEAEPGVLGLARTQDVPEQTVLEVEPGVLGLAWAWGEPEQTVLEVEPGVLGLVRK